MYRPVEHLGDQQWPRAFWMKGRIFLVCFKTRADLTLFPHFAVGGEDFSAFLVA
jgi:hypothetical protein